MPAPGGADADKQLNVTKMSVSSMTNPNSAVNLIGQILSMQTEYFGASDDVMGGT